jgi:HEAT repeat protein
MANALRDDTYRDQVRSIFLESNLAVMRSLLTAARQADERLGPLLLDIVAAALRERGSIEDCRQELCSLDPAVRLAGLEALALMRTAEAIELITGVVFNDPLPALRDRAALMLGELDDPTALAALRRAREVIPQRAVRRTEGDFAQ